MTWLPEEFCWNPSAVFLGQPPSELPEMMDLEEQMPDKHRGILKPAFSR